MILENVVSSVSFPNAVIVSVQSSNLPWQTLFNANLSRYFWNEIRLVQHGDSLCWALPVRAIFRFYNKARQKFTNRKLCVFSRQGFYQQLVLVVPSLWLCSPQLLKEQVAKYKTVPTTLIRIVLVVATGQPRICFAGRSAYGTYELLLGTRPFPSPLSPLPNRPC